MSAPQVSSAASPDCAPLRKVRLGSGVVVARGEVLVLIDDRDLGRAAKIWAAIGSDGSVDPIIDELARDGLRSIPTVVIAAAEGSQLRVIVRGAVTAEVVVGRTQFDGVAPNESSGSNRKDDHAPSEGLTSEAGTIVLDGTGVKSWSERTISDWSSCTLRIRTTDAPTQETVAAETDSVYLSEGLIFGSAVVWDRWSDITEAGSFESTSVAKDRAVAPAEMVEVPPVAVRQARPSASESPEVDECLDRPGYVEQPVPADARTPEALPADDGRADRDDPYAEMFGRTVHRDVQTAAVAETEIPSESDPTQVPVPSETEEVDSGSTRSFEEFERTHQAAEQGSSVNDGPPGADLGDHDGHTMTVAEIQRLRQGAELHAGSAAPHQRGDHDGHTISLTELRRMRSGDASLHPSQNTPHPSSVGPTVQAIVCPQGHPNPSYTSTCRICGQQLDGPIVVVQRPPLGRLRSSTGEVVEVDRPIIVGRNPSLSGRRLSEIPREWKIATADGLSRSHAMFHIDGWQVRVEDLGSVNSTTVTLPGREPEMLRVGEPVLITDGAIVDLGGEVTCRYEASV